MASDNNGEWYDVLLNAAHVADENDINNLKNLAHDHSYEKPYNFIGDNHSKVLLDVLSDEEVREEVDKFSKLYGNQSNHVQEVKLQFLVGTLPFPHINPVNSFDVACIEELNPDGSPVDKMHIPHLCGVHSFYEDWYSMMCISNRELCSCSVDGYASKHCESLGKHQTSEISCHKKSFNSGNIKAENKENMDVSHILKMIKDLGTEEGKKQRICKICDKTFTAVATLKYHYRSHANIKPYECILCNSKFTRKSGLNYHMQIHYNVYKYSCSTCSRKFRHTTHYKAHCKQHASGEKIQCSLCPSTFKTEKSLNRHMKNKHSTDERNETLEDGV